MKINLFQKMILQKDVKLMTVLICVIIFPYLEAPHTTDFVNHNMFFIYSRLGGCVAFYVNGSWFLAPAHCVVSRSGKFLKPTEVKLGAGGNITDVPDETFDQVMKYKISEIHVHNKYGKGPGENDIALLKVRGDIKEVIQGKAMQTDPWTTKGERSKFCRLWEWEWDINFNNQNAPKTRHVKYSYIVVAGHASDVCPCISLNNQTKQLLCIQAKRGCNFCLNSLGGLLECNRILYGISAQIIDCRHCEPQITISDCEQEYMYRTFTFLCDYRKWMFKVSRLEQFREKVTCHGNELHKPNKGSIFCPSVTFVQSQFLLVLFSIIRNFRLITI